MLFDYPLLFGRNPETTSVTGITPLYPYLGSQVMTSLGDAAHRLPEKKLKKQQIERLALARIATKMEGESWAWQKCTRIPGSV